VDEIVYISTITPVYRGCRTLAALVDELNVVRRQLVNNGGPVRLAEAIFVDDASEDGSGEALYALAREHEWIRVVTLSRNFGQHAATMAGILHASGDWIVTLDEDLQHHPRFILSLLERAVSGQHDIVYARPQTPPHKSVYRDASSALYKRVLGKLSGNPHVSMFNSFRMIRGSVARGASAVAADQTYFDVAVGWFTSRVSTLELPLVDVRYAEERESGYGWRTLLSHARRMLMSSDIKVVR
jgi:glycosyltransferase involved in cell wall biosynthesis